MWVGGLQARHGIMACMVWHDMAGLGMTLACHDIALTGAQAWHGTAWPSWQARHNGWHSMVHQGHVPYGGMAWRRQAWPTWHVAWQTRHASPASTHAPRVPQCGPKRTCAGCRSVARPARPAGRRPLVAAARSAGAAAAPPAALQRPPAWPTAPAFGAPCDLGRTSAGVVWELTRVWLGLEGCPS